MTNIIRQWNGQTIRQRADGYLSATDMCSACGKRFYNWERLDSTQEYLEVLKSRRYSDVSNGELIEIKQGGLAHCQGTWIHRKVAIRLAQWLSPEFAVQVDEWVEELLTTGKVELEQKPQQPQQPQLPQRDPIELTKCAKAIETVNNLTLQQLLRDELIDYLHIKQGKKALPGTTKKPEYTIAKVRAKELGYSMTEVGSGATLGKFIAKHIPAAFIERVGKYDVKHYEINEKLDALIHNYFALKANLA